MSVSPTAPVTVHPIRESGLALACYVTDWVLRAAQPLALVSIWIGASAANEPLTFGGLIAFAIIFLIKRLAALTMFNRLPHRDVATQQPGPAWRWALVTLPALSFAAAGVSSAAALTVSTPLVKGMAILGGSAFIWGFWWSAVEGVWRRRRSGSTIDHDVIAAEESVHAAAWTGAALLWIALSEYISPAPTGWAFAIAVVTAAAMAAVMMSSFLVVTLIEHALRIGTQRWRSTRSGVA